MGAAHPRALICPAGAGPRAGEGAGTGQGPASWQVQKLLAHPLAWAALCTPYVAAEPGGLCLLVLWTCGQGSGKLLTTCCSPSAPPYTWQGQGRYFRKSSPICD